MIIDNRDILKPFLVFNSPDDFYHLQILLRPKEIPGISSKEQCIREYYVDSLEYLDKKWQEIQIYCKSFKARAYINLNVRSFKKVALLTLQNLTNYLTQEDYKATRRAFSKAIGNCTTHGKKWWIIDIDTKEVPMTILNALEHLLNGQMQSAILSITHIPTKAGWHLITPPFDLKRFKTNVGDHIDVHRNNPTLLYMEINND